MDIVVAVLICVGLVSFLTGTIGILRFPDFYTRLHAAGKCDTLGSILLATGVALYNLQPFSWSSLLVSLKVMAIVAFVSVASPTATHALTKGALIVGIEPWIRKKEEP